MYDGEATACRRSAWKCSVDLRTWIAYGVSCSVVSRARDNPFDWDMAHNRSCRFACAQRNVEALAALHDC
jgi:hypothetical protein